jgi:carbamoyl-phosphate synthase large subunit
MINVLVTGVGGRSVGFHIMRSLLLYPRRFKVFVTDMSPDSAGLYFDPAVRGTVIPSCSSPDYMDSINKVCNENSIDIVIPGSEPELFKLSDKRESVTTKLLINPKHVIDKCRDKTLQYLWLLNEGYKPPLSATATKVSFLIEKCGFPIVVKPIHNTGGSRNVKLLLDWDELNSYLSEDWNSDMMFQEYVGTPDKEYTAAVMLDRNGKVIDSIIMHRILSDVSLQEQRGDYAISTGYSQVKVVRDVAMSRPLERLCTTMGMAGPANIQYRIDKNGDMRIFEIHPRFSGTVYMRATCDFNDPALLVLNFVNGEEFERGNYKYNIKLLKFFDHVMVPEYE